jgi:hypothetical protein
MSKPSSGSPGSAGRAHEISRSFTVVDDLSVEAGSVVLEHLARSTRRSSIRFSRDTRA